MLSELRVEGQSMQSLLGAETDRVRQLSTRLAGHEAAAARARAALGEASARLQQAERDAEMAASRLATVQYVSASFLTLSGQINLA